jgi:hypothetical protein
VHAVAFLSEPRRTSLRRCPYGLGRSSDGAAAFLASWSGGAGDAPEGVAGGAAWNAARRGTAARRPKLVGAMTDDEQAERRDALRRELAELRARAREAARTAALRRQEAREALERVEELRATTRRLIEAARRGR